MLTPKSKRQVQKILRAGRIASLHFDDESEVDNPNVVFFVLSETIYKTLYGAIVAASDHEWTLTKQLSDRNPKPRAETVALWREVHELRAAKTRWERILGKLKRRGDDRYSTWQNLKRGYQDFKKKHADLLRKDEAEHG